MRSIFVASGSSLYYRPLPPRPGRKKKRYASCTPTRPTCPPHLEPELSLQEGLLSNPQVPIDLLAEYTDLSRDNEDVYRNELPDLLRRKYRFERLARRELRVYEPDIEFRYSTDLPIKKLLEEVAVLPAGTVVLYLTMSRDSAGVCNAPWNAVSLMFKASSCPGYGLWDPFLGHGIVGGCLSGLETQGKTAAEPGLRILGGEEARDLPGVAERTNLYMFDRCDPQRWNLSERDLPPGSVVQYRGPSLLRQYRWQVLGILCLLFSQTLLLKALFFRRKKRSQLEAALRDTEVYYRTVADFAYDWVYWANPDGTLRYVSPSCERITGYSAQEFIDHPPLLREIILPEDQDIWDAHYQVSRVDYRLREIQYRIRAREGEIRWVEHACQPVTGDKGTFLGFRVSNRDITERKKAESELQEALSEISQLKDRLEAESTYLREEIKLEHDFGNIIGQSDALKYVLFKVEQVAPTDTTVLILGETGTGKELIARAIHHAGPRSGRALVKVNCAALPSSLMESELFGHERGAFTGAHARQLGRFELASGATLFLDEIGELPLDLQSKLLRVLQDGEFERLGSSRTIQVDVRIIAATNRDLESETRSGRFRKDLWYRLNVFPITDTAASRAQGRHSPARKLVPHPPGEKARKTRTHRALRSHENTDGLRLAREHPGTGKRDPAGHSQHAGYQAAPGRSPRSVFIQLP